MSLEFRSIEESERTAFMDVVSIAFGEKPSQEFVDRFRDRVQPSRVFGAFDGPQLVSTSFSLPLEITLPGMRRAPLAWIAGVTTLPSHLGRGAATGLLTEQLSSLRDEGYAFAALGTESHGFYQRVGFRPAASIFGLVIGSDRDLHPRGPLEVDVDFVSTPSIEDLMRLHERCRSAQLGEISRDARAWQKITGDDSRWITVREAPGGDLSGAIAYSIAHSEDKTAMAVDEVFAVDANVRRQLWQIICGFDIAGEIRVRAVAGDDPIFAMLTKPARSIVTRFDHPWLRLVDVENALQSRGYATPGSLVIEVTDRTLSANSGTFRLEVDDEGTGRVERASADADLALDVSDLASVYLGGRTFRTIADAGRVDAGRPDAVAAADRMFGVQGEPFCSLFRV